MLYNVIQHCPNYNYINYKTKPNQKNQNKQKTKKESAIQMIDQKQLEYLCKKYKIKYQFFESTDIAILDTG